MGHDLLLVNRKIPIKNIEHLAFHATDVPRVENTGTPRPNDVFHHLIIEVLQNEWNQHNELIHDVTANKRSGRKRLTLPASTRAPTKILSQAQRSVVIRRWGFVRLI